MSGQRRSVEALLVRYATAIDERRYELLDEVFTEDAELDFTDVGGRAGTYAEIRPWLERTLARYVALQHLMGNIDIELDGPVGRARSYVRAMHIYDTPTGPAHFELGGVYVDELERTDFGFRIRRRVLMKRFQLGEPPLREPHARR